MTTVNVEFLASLYNCNERTIQLWASKWRESGVEVTEERGLYDFEKFVKQKNLDYETKIEELEKGDATLYKLKQEHIKIVTREKELKLKKLIGELVNYDDVRMAWVGETKNFRKAAFAMGSKLDVNLEGVADKTKRRTVIFDAIREMLYSISENLRIETEAEIETDEFEDIDGIPEEPENELNTQTDLEKFI